MVLLSIIVPSKHTGIGAWVNSKMYTSILYETRPRPYEHPPVVAEKINTEYTGSLGYNSVFRVCYITSIDVDMIMDTCSTIEIMICYHK